jgi:hypothetical protein
MLRSILILPALLVGALLLGCGDQPAPSEPAIVQKPSLRTVRSPDGPGTFVIRFEDIIGFAFIPDDESITVLTGFTLEQLEVMCSGGEPTVEPASVQALSSPKLSRNVTKARDFTVLVFEGLFTFCDVEPFAVGEGNYTATGGTTFNGNAISYVQSTFQARVVEPNGEPHHIVVRLYGQFNQRTGEERILVNEFKFN